MASGGRRQQKTDHERVFARYVTLANKFADGADDAGSFEELVQLGKLLSPAEKRRARMRLVHPGSRWP